MDRVRVLIRMQKLVGCDRGQKSGEFPSELGASRKANVRNAALARNGVYYYYYFCVLRHSSFYRFVNRNRLQNHEPPTRVTAGQPFQHSLLLAFTR